MNLFLGILEFPTMLSPSLTRGSLPEDLLWNSKFICDEILGSSWGMTQP